jgi:hypothetical protein
MQNKLKIIPVVLLAGILLLIFSVGVFAKEHPGQVSKVTQLQKPEQGRVYRSLSNLCNWAYWVDWDGRSAHTPSDASGGFYPRGTTTTIFTDGFVWGGYVSDGRVNNPAVGGVTYNVGTVGGWIVTPGDGVNPPVAVSSDDPRVMIYRIRKDWQTLNFKDATVRQDAAELLEIDVDAVTDADALEVIADYEYAWNNWPGDVGAPYTDLNGNGTWDAGVDEPGIANADQVIWLATNDLDVAACEGLYGSTPIGLELQITMWSYNQPGATLGQLIFKKYTLINKSGFDVDSMFVSQWSDPDIGIYTDDLAGCDISRSLGYAYSGYLTDGYYTDFGLPPAAMGYDFFQGPLVDGVAGQDLNLNGVDDAADYGIWNLKKVGPGKINLPMTSFLYFAAGSAISDPPLADYDGTLQWYNMLNGYIPTVDLANPTCYTVGNTPGAECTKFPLSGDPFAGTGDVDATLDNLSAADRRIGMCSGPFFMANGDTQEVVVAVVGGIVPEVGGNNVNAVEQMKINDDFAQFVYDNLFQALPKAPQAPRVKVTELDGMIVLDWGSDSAAVAATEAPDPVLGYSFEGYNVYQLPTATAAKSQATLVATFDAVNLVRTIRGKKFVAAFGDIVEVPIQKGTDNGIKRYLTLEKDYITDKPLNNGNTYYFAVTGYNYNPDPDVPERTLESGLTAIIVIPQPTVPGVRYTGEPGQEIVPDHSTGAGEGQVQVTVIDPAATTGHEYQIYFTEDTDTNSATYGTLLWNVKDVATGRVKVSNQIQMATLDETDTQPIFDGLQVKVTGPELTFTSFQVTQNAAGVLDPPEIGCFAFNSNGFPLWLGTDRPDRTRQQTNGSGWGIHTGETGDASFEWFVTRTTQSGARWSQISPYDFEIRFNEDTDNWGLEPSAFNGAANVAIPVPFELWNIGVATPDDASDDYRLFPYLIDNNANGAFDLSGIDHSLSGGDNDPETDWFYWVKPADITPGEAGYNVIRDDAVNNTAGHVYLGPTTAGTDVMRRMVLVNWNGGSVSDATFPANVNAAMPEAGTVFRITSAKPNSVNDTFAFTAPTVTQSNTTAAADVAKINVFPNPYYAYNPSEPDRFTTFVTFNHLPVKATVRIFNLAGVQVRKLEKNDPTQFLRWNLRNERDIPVASGMYIAYIDMKDLGKEKVVKVMILQQQEQLKYY